MRNGSEALSVTATAKVGHGSDKILRSIHITITHQSDKFGAMRNHHTQYIEELDKVVKNTRLRNRGV